MRCKKFSTIAFVTKREKSTRAIGWKRRTRPVRISKRNRPSKTIRVCIYTRYDFFFFQTRLEKREISKFLWSSALETCIGWLLVREKCLSSASRVRGECFWGNDRENCLAKACHWEGFELVFQEYLRNTIFSTTFNQKSWKYF